MTRSRFNGARRRGLLAVAAGVAGVLAVAAAPWASSSPSPAIRLGALPLLLADAGGIAAKTGVVRSFHPGVRHPEPVVVADQPWEGDRVYIYGTVHRDPATGRLRMWYMTRPQPEYPGEPGGRVPNLRENGRDLDLFATSDDGLRWTKVRVGQYAYAGSRDNNIVFDLHSPSVLVDAMERDPARRYKMLGALSGNYYAAVSPDGLHWTSDPVEPVLKHSDTITLAQNPSTGEYLAYHKRPATLRGHPRRVVWLSRSRDFRTWTEPELVFAPDEQDDAWTTEPQHRTEVYNMSVYPHAGGFIGLPTIFRVMTERARSEVVPGQSPVDGPIDVELATSPDGREWHRTPRRTIMIPRGAPGTFDGGAILGVASAPVHTDRETWVYYTALTTGHGAPIGPKRIAIGRAAWRRHGFASLDAGPDGGRVETRPLVFDAASLVVNADASRGRVRVALLEADGRPIPGFTLDDAVPLTADETVWRAAWRGGAPVPRDRPVRVAVEMTNARLYSLAAE